MSNPFTHKKLTEVKDSALDFGHGDVMEARFAGEDLEAEDTGFGFHRLYVIVRGDGRMKLDDEVIEVERLDAIRVAPEVTRAFEAGDEGLEILVFGPRHDGDGEVYPGWWSD